ncbi:MAG: glycosyltransferase family 4 protein [Anaerolineae bacterium]
MKTIGVVHYQVGRMDGVSLEIDKWKRVLESMGHRVRLCAGDLSSLKGTLIEEIYHHRPEIARLYHNTFETLDSYPDESSYRAEMERLAEILEEKLCQFVEEQQIDYLLPENVLSVGINPPLSIAMNRVMRDRELPGLAHHHDFYWEREHGVALTCGTALELVDLYLPPRYPRLRHAVINSRAQKALAERKGLSAGIVPNVFDFDAPAWERDDYNQDFRARIGLRPEDIVILQATRITPRKGIELAVDFCHALGRPEHRARLQERGLYDGRAFTDTSRIVLVLAGYSRDDLTGTYLERLKTKIEREQIDALFIEDLIEGRRQTRAGQKIYSLWDSYVFADFVTYPSLDEGFGNQFLEALCARLPIMVFEYEVYRDDIKDKGFRVVSLGSTIEGYDDLGRAQVPPATSEMAAYRAVDLLTNAQLRQEIVEHNLALAREHYSLERLRDYLTDLVGE